MTPHLIELGEYGRALIMREGSERVVFTIVDRDGRVATLGRLEETGLNCVARAAILVCSEPGGLLRAWRLPAWPVGGPGLAGPASVSP